MRTPASQSQPQPRAAEARRATPDRSKIPVQRNRLYRRIIHDAITLGTALFDRANFSGISFEYATFAGPVRFDRADFGRESVSFADPRQWVRLHLFSTGTMASQKPDNIAGHKSGHRP